MGRLTAGDYCTFGSCISALSEMARIAVVLFPPCTGDRRR